MRPRSFSHLLLVLAGSLAFGCAESPVGPGGLSERGEQAFAVLRSARALAGASVGFAGTTPETVEAFRVLLEEQEAAEAFESLLAGSSKPGQLYALAGLYLTDRPEMERQAGKYLRDGSRIETHFGCIIDRERVSALAGQIVSGALPLEFKGRRE